MVFRLSHGHDKCGAPGAVQARPDRRVPSADRILDQIGLIKYMPQRLPVRGRSQRRAWRDAVLNGHRTYIVRTMFFNNLGDEISGIMARDPAARSRREVVLAYPGFHALLFYR